MTQCPECEKTRAAFYEYLKDWNLPEDVKSAVARICSERNTRPSDYVVSAILFYMRHEPSGIMLSSHDKGGGS